MFFAVYFIFKPLKAVKICYPNAFLRQFEHNLHKEPWIQAMTYGMNVYAIIDNWKSCGVGV